MKKCFEVMLSVSLLLCVLVPGWSQEVLDRIAAIVDDDIILESEVMQNARLLAMQLSVDPAKNPQRYQELLQQTLDQLIIRHILLTKAEEDTVVPDQVQVDRYLEQQMQNLLDNLGSEEKIEEQFGLPIKKLRSSYEEEIRKNLTITMLRDQKFATTRVSKREVQQFYTTNKDSLQGIQDAVDISHILIVPKPGEAAREAAMARIQEAIRRLDAGEDFAELARAVSEDPGSGARGGDLGIIERGGFVREFEEAAFALEPGERSDIVETQFGFHVIELIERLGEKIHARHILVRLQATREDELAAAERIKEIAVRVRESNEDFANVAREVSMDAENAAAGGYLGMYEIAQLEASAQYEPLAKAFLPVVRDMQEKEISDPFQSQYGFHIVRCNSRQYARPFDLEADWETIERYALANKKQVEFNAWIEELRKDIYIEIKER